ncbi:MAG: hypothetical protein EXX96DRAFT_506893 [Benjaminiella poitrasii]|nr:MAG: hypothetical protein EXX96DRAFT_506893 [Benjaminiella poitrasii]
MPLTVAEKICKQVDFYLSDSNLPYDKFLWTLHSNSADGWIPIETIANFKRMKFITEDLDTIVKALKENESEIYAIDEEGKNIKRKTEVVEQNQTDRSIYVKGLPLVDVDAKDPVVEIFKLQDRVDELFSEKAKILSIRFKKNKVRPYKLKGSAYIEFETPEDAKKVAELKDIEFDGQKLEIMYQPDYFKMKAEQYSSSNDTTPIPKRKYKFNAFRLQADNNKSGNKRKNNSGFAKTNNKKTKTNTEEKAADKE